MDEIVPGLFISSWESVKDSVQLKKCGISTIVAVGCKYEPEEFIADIEYELCPKVLDDPEVLIAHIFGRCNQRIQSDINSCKNILVHCVLGQSRSAAVCVAYLLHTGLGIIDALNLIKEKHADICINPGFLSQLHLFAQLQQDSSALPVYRLLLSSHGCVDEYFEKTDVNLTKKYSCKLCGYSLCVNSDVLDQIPSNDEMLKQFTDSYWSNYRPQSSYNTDVVKFPLSNTSLIAVAPVEWMQDQMKVSVNAREGELSCPGCREVCGSWRRKCLNVIGPYNLCDLITLNRKAVKIKRIIG